MQVDPLLEALPPSEPIDKELKEKYLQDIASLKKQLDALEAKPIKKEEKSELIEVGESQVSQL